MSPQVITQITFYDRPIPITEHSAYSLGTGKWQGDVLDAVKQTDHPELYHLFHNKDSEYPVIQFRNDGGYAALAGIGKEASWAVAYFAEAYAKKYPESTNNTFQQTAYYTPMLLKTPKTYHIERYLFPHSKRKTYQNIHDLWKDIDDITTRLKNNIYELVHKQLGFSLPDFALEIQNISAPTNFRTYKPHGTFFERGVQLTFAINMLLPPLTAIATSKSKGYGCLITA
ncbi:hypothetical protein H2O64_04615 [Kordia sp. YSTF-M3]|uniref:Uncharacterized protein n=1 Tax=Kordia aestuariivivens TaxID=2759037 RepID=A0ABR7Q5V4_9FLAO|nr:hypothetical protein [Kordia aestuariivivens]MBC8753941.1 hypothetical protein [Kordia aestuariivivens]